MRAFSLLVILSLLSGCSSMNPLNWLAPDEEVNPPSELVEMENLLGFRSLWSSALAMDDKRRVKLVPAVRDGVLYLAGSKGEVRALDAQSGEEIWSLETGLSLAGGPGIGEGLVFLGTADAELLALDAADGSERWRATLSSEVLSVPKADRGVAVVHTVDGKLFGFDVADGSQLWIYDRSVPVLSLYGNGSPVVGDGAVISGFASGKLVALDIATGDVFWEVNINLPSGRSELERMVDVDGDPLLLDGNVYVSSYQGDLAAVSASTGVVFWRRAISSHQGVAADWRNLYLADAEGQVWAIDPANGAALWKNKKLQYRKLSAPVVSGEYVLVGDFEGYLHWLAVEDGRLLARIRIGSHPISVPPAVDGELVYVFGDGGELQVISLAPPTDS